MEKVKEIGKPMAFIGFSANPEIIVRINRLEESEKAPLEEMTCELGGTSSNVAKAMAKMGIQSTLYTLTGYNDDFYTHCFRYALKYSHEKIQTVEFPILEQGHMGFIPIDGIKKSSQVFGYKGNLLPSKISDCIKIIEQDVGKNVWKIATGTRPSESDLVKALFGENHKGFRYLNPRMDLIQSKEIFFNLLRQTDVLVINHAEYEACTHYKEIGSRADIQKMFGVSLVVVTKDRDGGKYSLSNNVTEVTEKFDAYTDYIFDGEEIFPTGAGDWFAGSLISFFVKTGKSILEITEEEIKEAIYFAAKVAGKKITMRGAGNGPSGCDL
ncbi:MAG: PfkB family carbohydrate kinase [Candidatus Paceibacterota bacterium]